MPRTTNAAGRIRDESLMNLGGRAQYERSDKRAQRQKSATTKERRDKRAPRQNSVRQINTVTRQDFEKAAVNVFTEEVAFSIFRRQFIGMSNLQDSKHLMLQILNLH
ncbi:hypothetical protein MTP99_014121 [Tenebrio molitor]|jgi:hypothetical protein|nr:hypothetical protein MTP99_014121 [Tenebrio molitor]